MGYRSDFELVINAASPEHLTKFRTWLGLVGQEESDIGKIAKMFLIDFEELISDKAAVYREYAVKCYDPWDQFIDRVFEFCVPENGLDCGYARIGEDYSDNEVRWGKGAYTTVHITRSFDDYQLDDVPIPTKE